MRKTALLVALLCATTLMFGQESKNKEEKENYKVNNSGAQKITNGPVIEYTSDHSAMIAWSTKYPGGTYVAYGTSASALNQRAEKSWGGTNHRVELKGLRPDTTYYFQVRTEDAKGQGAAGADVESNVDSFKTQAKGHAPDRANHDVGVVGTKKK